MSKIEDILEIPVAEGRRGLEKAKKIVESILDPALSPDVDKPKRTKPGKVKATTKVVT